MEGGDYSVLAETRPDVVMLVLLFLCMTNRVNKVTIRIKGSSLGMSFDPRGAGSSPARDKTFV